LLGLQINQLFLIGVKVFIGGNHRFSSLLHVNDSHVESRSVS
jgi:hypothetical protein